MKKTLALVSALALGVAATPAMAQEANSTFTGPRVEGVIGYSMTGAGSTVDNDANSNDDQDIDGLLYGGAVGFDFALGGVLVGAEAELTDSTAKVEFSDDGDF